MALSEAADIHAAAAHEWGLTEAPPPVMAVQKNPPPRPPAARPPTRPAPPKAKEVAAVTVDPWADEPATTAAFLPEAVVPVRQEVLVHAAPPEIGWGNWDSMVSSDQNDLFVGQTHICLGKLFGYL